MSNSTVIASVIGIFLMGVIIASPKIRDMKSNHMLDKDTIVEATVESSITGPERRPQREVVEVNDPSGNVTNSISPFDEEDESVVTNQQEEIGDLCDYVQKEVDGYLLKDRYIYPDESLEDGSYVFKDTRDKAKYIILYNSNGRKIGVEYYKETEED